MKLTRSVTALGTAGVFAISLTACSGGAGGEWSASIDGQPIEIENATVACQSAGGFFQAGVTDVDNPDKALVLQMTEGDTPSVEQVALFDQDGTMFGYNAAITEGSAELTVDGDTYTVTGDGAALDFADPMGLEILPYEFSVTCS